MKKKIQRACESASINDNLLPDTVKVEPQNEIKTSVREMRMWRVNYDKVMRWLY